MNKKSNLLFTFSRTITRPRMREIIPIIYEDGNGNSLLGNENLNYATDYNLDIRYELFPSITELFSFLLFGKYIENPIERGFVPLSTGRAIQFSNFDQAYLFCIEHKADINLGKLFKLEARKHFSF